MDFFREKNAELYRFLDETFKINKSTSWKEISQQITKERIKATYRFFAKLFPINEDYQAHLSAKSTNFKTIHFGTLKGNQILSDIVRFSLYSDEIIVFHPLQNPVITNPRINPAKQPTYWLHDFMSSLYFYIVLQKWVKAGIVHLIINPYDYNFSLRDATDKKVEERIKKTDREKFYIDNRIAVLYEMAEYFALIYGSKNELTIKEELLKMQHPTFTESDAAEFASIIKQVEKKKNPLYANLNIPLNRKSLAPTKGGGPLESILQVAELANGNIYTTDKGRWSQIQDIGYNEFWAKVNHLYSKVNLNFLDNVDTGFALNLREDGRLEGVRKEFRTIFSSLNLIDIKDLKEKFLIELQESFIEEIKKSESEWKLIKKQAQNARINWAAATASAGVTMVASQVSILPLFFTSASLLLLNVRNEQSQLEKYKVSNPLSVYIDLKNKNNGFFSELKNCIF